MPRHPVSLMNADAITPRVPVNGTLLTLTGRAASEMPLQVGAAVKATISGRVMSRGIGDEEFVTIEIMEIRMGAPDEEQKPVLVQNVVQGTGW